MMLRETLECRNCGQFVQLVLFERERERKNSSELKRWSDGSEKKKKICEKKNSVIEVRKT